MNDLTPTSEDGTMAVDPESAPFQPEGKAPGSTATPVALRDLVAREIEAFMYDGACDSYHEDALDAAEAVLALLTPLPAVHVIADGSGESVFVARHVRIDGRLTLHGSFDDRSEIAYCDLACNPLPDAPVHVIGATA